MRSTPLAHLFHKAPVTKHALGTVWRSAEDLMHYRCITSPGSVMLSELSYRSLTTKILRRARYLHIILIIILGISETLDFFAIGKLGFYIWN